MGGCASSETGHHVMIYVSASLGRMCGSIWASAVLPALLEESTSNSAKEANEILPKTLMKNNERRLVRSADLYLNICSRKLIVKPPNMTLPLVPKMMNGVWYGLTGLGFLLPTIANVIIS